MLTGRLRGASQALKRGLKPPLPNRKMVLRILRGRTLRVMRIPVSDEAPPVIH